VNTLSGNGLSGAIAGGVAVYVFILIASLIGPVLGLLMGIRSNGLLPAIRDDLAFAAGGVGAGIGQFILGVLTALGATIPSTADIGVGDFLSVIILSSIITGIVASLAMYVLRNTSGPQTDSNTSAA